VITKSFRGSRAMHSYRVTQSYRCKERHSRPRERPGLEDGEERAEEDGDGSAGAEPRRTHTAETGDGGPPTSLAALQPKHGHGVQGDELLHTACGAEAGLSGLSGPEARGLALRSTGAASSTTLRGAMAASPLAFSSPRPDSGRIPAGCSAKLRWPLHAAIAADQARGAPPWPEEPAETKRPQEIPRARACRAKRYQTRTAGMTVWQNLPAAARNRFTGSASSGPGAK